MKQRFTWIFLFLLLSCPALAQDSDSLTTIPDFPKESWTIHKTNPSRILYGPIPLTAEYRYIREETTAHDQGTYFGLSYLGKSPLVKMIETMNSSTTPSYNQPQYSLVIRGYRLQLGHKFYLNDKKNAPYGLYFGPHFSYSYAKITTKYFNMRDEYYRVFHMDLSMHVGYQLIIWEQFAVDLYAGMGLKQNRWVYHQPPNNNQQFTDINDITPFYGSPVKFAAGLNFGWVR